MSLITGVKDRIFSADEDSFDALALEIFLYQSENNPLYKQYLSYIGIKPECIEKVAQIPFLPIELFKNHKIITGNVATEYIFESSGTTGGITSRHYISDISIYNKSIESGFRKFFGDPAEYTFLALLPSYLERKNSSLTYMMKHLMEMSKQEHNGFYLYEHDKLFDRLLLSLEQKEKVFLIGVSFALLDFAEKFQPDLSGAIVMETGGMKGRRKELIREEVHDTLKKSFQIPQIMSEYGMAELLSQAYAKENGSFETPGWMKIMIRDVNDPFSMVSDGQSGGINIIDLANINSCSFIATQDIGRMVGDGKTEIAGRFDQSDIRGCSLMYQ
jgi:phenylacetate-coenzyme A ligase PaaK-like adenylate-forming protein